MKKLLALVALICGLSAHSQVRISDMPTFIGNPSGGYVPIVIGGVNRKIDAIYFGVNKLDSVYKKTGTDSLFSAINGAITFITRADTITGGGGGSSNTNVGAGFRAAINGTNNVKTFFPGYGFIYDSTTNTNGLTGKVDSAALANYFPRRKDSTISFVTPTQLINNSNLQVVTNNGNFTTNPIYVQPGGNQRGIGLVYSSLGGALAFTTASNKTVNILSDYIDSNFALDLPRVHRPGTTVTFMPVSVNGTLADTTGNITLPVGTGTVTVVGGTSSNGFTIAISNPTTNSNITIGTSITGILKGNGTAASAAVDGTDYLSPNGGATLLNKNLTSGTNTFPTFNQNTTGTAANLSGTPALNNGITATTQALNDSSTRLATTAQIKLDSIYASHLYKGQKIDTSNIPFSTLNVSSTGGGFKILSTNLKDTLFGKTLIAGTGITLDSTTTAGAIILNGTAATAWGAITGTLSSQTDLNTALGLKAPITNPAFLINGAGTILIGTATTTNKIIIDSAQMTTASGYKVISNAFVVSAGGSINSPSAGNNFTVQTRGFVTAQTFAALQLGSGTMTNSSATAFDVSIIPTYNQTSTGAGTDLLIQRIETTIGTGQQNFVDMQVGTTSKYRVDHTGHVYVAATITAIGTTGAQTINGPAGSINIAASGTSVVLTNNQITTSSIVTATIGTNDATAKSVQVVTASGSCTFFLNAAATATTPIFWTVTN